MNKVASFAVLALTLLLACEKDPAHESGKPDDRPTPETTDAAMAQEADRQERQKTLKAAGLCTPQAIRSIPEPDERFWHCRGQDWTGSTEIKEKLAELSADPAAYREYCETPIFDGLGIQLKLCDGLEHPTGDRP